LLFAIGATSNRLEAPLKGFRRSLGNVENRFEILAVDTRS
jgi:hypothetical protein